MSWVKSKVFYVRRADDVDTEGSWVLSYGDMVTLLLMFFMIFFSVDPQRDRYNAMQLALLKELSLKDTPVDGMKDVIRVGNEQGEGTNSALLAQWGGKATPIGSKILVEFPGVSFFDFGRLDLNEAGMAQLKKFSQSYLPYAGSYLLAIRAFTDNVPVASGKGRFSDNLELSALRSIAALRELQRAGIPLQRMRAEGYGELRLNPKVIEEQKAESIATGDRGIRNARKIVLIIEPDSEDRL